MQGDITEFLKLWPYDFKKHIRIIKAKDGRDILQVRQPLGLEQYELTGRPDGKRPDNKESYLHIIQDRLEKYIANNATEQGFTINHEDFLNLQNEGILYYYRYLVLFQIGEFEKTARDTKHNLNLCHLVEKYMEDGEDKSELLQYRPYILRMLAVSKAMVSLHKHLKSAARNILESTIEEIENLPNIDTPAFQFERIRSLNYLQSTIKQILDKNVTVLDNLETELDTAVKDENYERAAKLRDQINALNRKHKA